MDKKLQAAIKKGKTEKENRERHEREIQDAKLLEHEKFIKSQLPKAKKWIEEVLFNKIAEAEANGYSKSIYLGSYSVGGISAEAIYEAAKKFKGLKPTYQCAPIYENAEFQGVDVPEYSIGWESIDSDDNKKE